MKEPFKSEYIEQGGLYVDDGCIWYGGVKHVPDTTCHNISQDGGTGLLCDVCGAYTPWIADATHAFPARRCGNCGAKAVER